jgi:hypothetical protein
MGERTKNFGIYQPFTHFLNTIDRKDADTYFSGTENDYTLTGEGVKKLKKKTGLTSLDPERLKEFEEIMLPVIAAMIYKDNYLQRGFTPPATVGEAAGTRPEDYGI